MSELCARYAGRREAEKHSTSPSPPTKQKYIRNWRMRHLRPLTDFFPFAIRYGLERGIRHVELNKALTKEIAVNELALAQCEIFLMREKRKKPSGDMLKTKPQSTKETKEEVKETSKNEKPAKRQRAFGARNSKEQESGRLDPDLFRVLPSLLAPHRI